jgi:hypothetical protein
MQSATAGVLRRKYLASSGRKYNPLITLKIPRGSKALLAARHLARGNLTVGFIAALKAAILKMSSQLIAPILPMWSPIAHVAKHRSTNSYRIRGSLVRIWCLTVKEFATSSFLVVTFVKPNVILAIVDSAWKQLRFRVDVGEPHLHPFVTREMSNSRGA